MRGLVALLVAGTLVIAGCSGRPESHGGGAAGAGPTAAVVERPAELAPGALVDRLRAGGLAIVIRHGRTDSAQDADPIDVADCSTQRNLSAQGRAESEAMGAAIRELGIPIGYVLSSVYCRAMDTGRLAFGRVEAADAIDGRAVWPPDAAKRALAGERLRGLIRERLPAAPDRNTVMIVHQLFPDALDGTTLGEGEAVVYELSGDRIVNLGTVAPDGWAGLA
jgi:Histidine phosphatase superfamily (branch 1)